MPRSIALRVNRDDVAALRVLHAERAEIIRRRLREFAAVPPSEYFYELAYCLLTPQSSAANADAVVQELRRREFLGTGFDPESLLRDPRHYIRFHRVKARRLQEVRGYHAQIQQLVESSGNARERRDLLVARVNGFGMKEASHYLRNIGRNDGLAILDRHILRNLKRYGAIRTIPSSLTRKRYLALEKRFGDFASAIGIPIDELDLLFWSMETGEVRK